jgi:putative peptidoglycan lipid II flippase
MIEGTSQEPPEQSRAEPSRAGRAGPGRGRHAARRPAGGGGGLLRSSALMAVGTVVSRATGLIRQVLQAFGLGLIPFSAQYLLLRGFYAFEDTRTPFRLALCIGAVNIALATGCHLLLPPRWAVTGMAAAYAVSYGIGMLLTAARLRRRTGGLLDGRRICRTYGRLVAAATSAGAVGWLVARSCSNGLTAAVRTPALSLAAGGITMALLFLLLARAFKIRELPTLPGLS